MIKRYLFDIIKKRVVEDRKYIQIILGPRQVGKTTLMLQIEAEQLVPVLYSSADDAQIRDFNWLSTQWQRARLLARKETRALLVIDEVQKIASWSEGVKALWDEDTRNKLQLQVILLGSTPIFAARGISESLAGRFETIYVPHWSYKEMHEVFGYSFEDYLYYGGYPGSAPLRDEILRWRSYVRESIIESTVSRDLLSTVRIEKPILLRSLFFLACEYGGRVLSYTKILGQLQDAGNTTTLAHYLDLLSQCGLVCGLQKYSGESIRSRASSPKLIALDSSLITASSELLQEDWFQDNEAKGHLIENVIGAHLWRASKTQGQLFYWSEGKFELDFVYVLGRKILAIEVKSGRKPRAARGLTEFQRRYPEAKGIIVGTGGIPIEEFLTTDVWDWI